MEFKSLELERIVPSPMNVRKTFEQDELMELAENIEEQGLIQAITVRPNSALGEYEVICGERRFRAFNILAKKDKEKFGKIPCVIREMNDQEAFEAMITENLQRKDVDPIEEANAFYTLAERGMSIEDIASKFGKSYRFIQDRIKLNNLIVELKKRLKEGEITISGAMMLSKLSEKKQRDFNELYDGEVSNDRIKQFIRYYFMKLENVLWEGKDEWEDGSFLSCSECSFNTANHGCLFYEMKAGPGRCTKRECFNNKTVATIIREAKNLGDELVKSGCALEFGKSVCVYDPSTCRYSENSKEMMERVVESLKTAGIEVVDASKCFGSICYYGEDDERLQNFLIDKKVYRCYDVFRYGSPSFVKKYFYVRRDTSTSDSALASTKEVEINKLVQKREVAERKCNEHQYNAVVQMLKSSDYKDITTELSENERLSLDVCILMELGYGYLTANDMPTCVNNGLMDYIKEHQQDRLKWYRAFILSKITEPYYAPESSSEYLQNIICAERYKEEREQATSPIQEKYDRKIEKINQQINDIKEA